jgi:hypothetical protein
MAPRGRVPGLMSDEKKPFTVTDRRHFAPEGTPRPDEVERSADPPAEQPEPAAGQEPFPGLDGSDYDGEDMPPVPADLSGLVITLAAQASMLLGAAPGGGQPDMDGARGVISLLEMLHEKTRGNRTPEEDRLLDDVLYKLRMGFVMRAKGGA